MASQVVAVVKDPPANAGDMRHSFDPWVGKIPWRRAWQPTPVFLAGESHGQRSLVGYSPWGCRVGHNWSDLAWTRRQYRSHFLDFERLKEKLIYQSLSKIANYRGFYSHLGSKPGLETCGARGYKSLLCLSFLICRKWASFSLQRPSLSPKRQMKTVS